MSYQNVVGGKLNLKSGGVKKPKTKKSKQGVAEDDEFMDRKKAKGAAGDKRTAAERRYEEKREREEVKLIKKLAEKTHKEKLDAFNSHLATLSEHHDIPRVGPG
mmetsp:Transcript_6962/g.25642  ORF Transcript_6962/g.25642 Transcript_6962/m.25642 type:complete len:104 (+) Transcript_6962:141-452(+)